MNHYLARGAAALLSVVVCACASTRVSSRSTPSTAHGSVTASSATTPTAAPGTVLADVDPRSTRDGLQNDSATLARGLPPWASLRGASLIEHIRTALGNTCQVAAIEREGVVDPYHWRIQCAADSFFRSGSWTFSNTHDDVRCPLATGATTMKPWACVGRLVAEVFERGSSADRPIGVDILLTGGVDADRVDPTQSPGGSVDFCPEERTEAGFTPTWLPFTRADADSEQRDPAAPLHVQANHRLSFCRALRTWLTFRQSMGATATVARASVVGSGTEWFDRHPAVCRARNCRSARRIDMELRFTMQVDQRPGGCDPRDRNNSLNVLQCFERNSRDHGARFTQRVPQTGNFPLFVEGAPEESPIVHRIGLGPSFVTDPRVIQDLLR